MSEIHESEAEPVPEQWVQGFAGTRAAEDVDRLAGDLELVNDLRAIGFVGPGWDRFANTLAAYGFAVLTTWIRSKVVFVRCAQKGLGRFLPRTSLQVSPQDAEDLASETVALAIRRFRSDVLVPGRWDPSRGASLKSFFIGQCLIRFTNVYKTWSRREQSRRLAELSSAEVEEWTTPRLEDDPSFIAAARDQRERALRTIPDLENRLVAELVEGGWSQPEIGEVLGLTPKAVELRVARIRGRLRRGGFG